MAFDTDSTVIAFGENFADLETRVDKIPLMNKAEVAAEHDCLQEFAGVIYLLQNDLNIEPKLILSDLQLEIARLEAVEQTVPEVETYIYKFAIKEGKWIAFLRGSLANSLTDDIKSIQVSFGKLGKLHGSNLITLATQLMMERQFIGANKLIPLIEKWQEEHPNSTELDAAKQILASIIVQPVTDEITNQIVETQAVLLKQIELLGDILSNAEQSNWIIRSLIEAEILYEDLKQPATEMSSKALADIIIWLLSDKYQKQMGDFTTTQDMGKLIMRFQLESALGLSTATPQAKLEYNLLSLTYKDTMAKSKLSEQIILDAWKESRLTHQALESGREILAMLMDYSNLSNAFLTKIPRHFEFITTYYKAEKLRLNRGLERFKIKGAKPTETEMQEAVIVDYLIQFVKNHIVGKVKADPKDLIVPDEHIEIDLSIAEKDIVDMIDAALQRGLRTKNKSNAIRILEAQISSMYQRLLNVVDSEIGVGETILYGVFNANKKKISREEAQELIMKHFKRMKVSLETSGKKRIDSVVQKAILIEVEEKIINRDIR